MGLAVIELSRSSRLFLEPVFTYRWSQRYNAAFNGTKKICYLRPMHEAAAAAKPTSLQRPGFPQEVPNVMRNSLAAEGTLAPIILAIERDEMIMEARDFSMNTTELDKALEHSLARLGL